MKMFDDVMDFITMNEVARWAIRWLILFAIIMAVLASAGLASADQQSCVSRDAILNHLARNYDEAPVAVGVTNGNTVIELLTTKDGATWTLMVSHPNGMSCPLASGENWRSLKMAIEPTI